MQELSMHVLDIAQNSVSAGAGRITITVEDDEAADRIRIEVADDGRGMTEEEAKNALDPFYTTRTTRKVGLGLPLFKMAAEMAGGSFELKSEPGVGTVVTAVFGRSHIDRMPIGDMAETMAPLICMNEEIDIVYTYVCGGGSFSVSTAELREALDGTPLSVPQVMKFVTDYIREHSDGLRGRSE